MFMSSFGTDFVFNDDKGFSIVTFEFDPAIAIRLLLMRRGATEENDCIDGTPSSSSAVIMTTRERLTTTNIFIVEDKSISTYV